MCVKCGISSCGSCEGKSCDVSLTGDITYDGLPITCATDESINIASGDKLNDVIQTILAGLCPPFDPTPYLLREDLDLTVPDANPLLFGTAFVAPEDGTYHLRLDVRGSLKSDIIANVSLYNSTDSIEAIGPETFELVAVTGQPNDVVVRNTMVMEKIVTLTKGDSLSARVVGATGNGSVAIFRTTIYAQRLS